MWVRYTTGPDELSLGAHFMRRNEWVTVPDALAEEVKKQPRTGDYDFEVTGDDPAKKKPAKRGSE